MTDLDRLIFTLAGAIFGMLAGAAAAHALLRGMPKADGFRFAR